MAQAPALGEVVSNTSAKERQHKCEVLISEAMGIASVQTRLLTGTCRMSSHSNQMREMRRRSLFCDIKPNMLRRCIL